MGPETDRNIIMTKTHEGRISSLETIYTEILKPIPEDLKEIKETVQRIDLKMFETERRVLEHHDFMKDSKAVGCPRPRNNPGTDSDREHKERKTDKKIYRYRLYGSVFIGIASVISTILLIIFR